MICCVDVMNIKFVSVVRALLVRILYNSVLCFSFGSLLATVEIVLLIC